MNEWLAWALKNSVAIICWTVLAVTFEHWWIAFFALLFMSDLKTERTRETSNKEENKTCGNF